MPHQPTIFVQIASYRDPELGWTVKDLFAKAEHPERITVGICQQCFPAKDKDCMVEPSAQVRIVNALPSESLGVCWARAAVQTLFQDQDYVLMIDSHMRFIPHWDTALIDELARCPSPKAFLSTYPAGYKPPDQLQQDPRPTVLRAKPFNEQGDIRFDGETLEGLRPEKPLRTVFLAAGFIFAPGKFVREVPYDPYIYFDHEEITLAVRAFTHGWDIYSPPGTFLYHYYHEPHKGETRALHWSDNRDWGELQKASRARYDYLLADLAPENPEALQDINKYGLGSVRSVREFEDFSGIDFKKKTVSERALTSGFIEGLDRYRQPQAAAPLTAATGYLMPDVPTYDWQRFAGHRRFFCVMPSAFEDYVNEFMRLYRGMHKDFEKAGYDIAVVEPDEKLCRALGIAQSVHDTPYSYLLDKNRKIIGFYNNRSAFNHIHDLLRRAQS